MIKKKDKKLLVGLEIGTTKTITMVGEILSNNTINIIGVGQCQSEGIEKGNINNLKSVINCIKKTINKSEKISECHITSVHVALSNQYIKCKNEIGIVPIYNNIVTKKDIEYSIYTAQSIKLHQDYNILHVIPQEYSIDQQDGIRNPIGLSGHRMKSKVHIIIYKKHLKKNIVTAIQHCNLKVKKIIFSGLAASEAILSIEEKKSGVCVIDIGGGNINITIYINGYIQHSQVIPYAGNTITNDIAYAFNTTFQNAEMIKINYGSTIFSSLSTTEFIEISNKYGINKKKIQKNILFEVIESRYFELLNIVNKIIMKVQKKLYYNNQPYILGSGVVITGGSAQISSLKNFAEKIFNMPIRIGLPTKIQTYDDKIIHPSYTTVIGLLKYGLKLYNEEQNDKNKNINHSRWLKILPNWLKKIIKIK